MPYAGVPAGEATERMEKCVAKVMASGKPKDSAIAICHDSIVGKKTAKTFLYDTLIALANFVKEKPQEEEIIEEGEVKDDKSDMLLWKDKSGNWRWLAIWSNKYRDFDTPQEILSDAAHRDFVRAIDNKEWPMPELWHWHIPGTRWGIADWVAYDDEKGFILASGTIDKGHENEAIAMKNTNVRIKVSHGMPESEIRRDVKDNTIITRYRTVEISDLPSNRAANQLTAFAIKSNKEKIMAISSEKLQYLEQVGLSDEDLKTLNSTLENGEKAAKDLGLESKEKADDETEAPETGNAEAPPNTEDTSTKQGAEVELVAKAEVADALTKLSNIVEENTKTLLKEVEELKSSTASLIERLEKLEATDGERVSDKAVNTPTASLADLIALSIIGKEQTKVDGRTSLAKQKPAEPVVEKEVLPVVGIPFLDQMLNARS